MLPPEKKVREVPAAGLRQSAPAWNRDPSLAELKAGARNPGRYKLFQVNKLV
jgi:hypothetical protein